MNAQGDMVPRTRFIARLVDDNFGKDLSISDHARGKNTTAYDNTIHPNEFIPNVLGRGDCWRMDVHELNSAFVRVERSQKQCMTSEFGTK